MSSEYGLVYPLWTDPHKPAELLDRAVGEVGVKHLTIPLVTGKITQFRLNAVQPPHLFHTEGGWHYPPQAECYATSRVRPRVARWTGKRNLLARVCEYARQRELNVFFRLAPRAATTLLEHEPHLQPRNAWGDELLSAGACVLNPELRELLQATLEDLRRYEPAGFQLADWLPDLAVDRDTPRPLDWHPLVRELLDICFCPACRQAATVAGIDADQAARSVRVYVERFLTRPQDDTLAAKLRQDEVVNAYLQARRRDTSAWLQGLAESHPRHQQFLLTDLEAYESISSFLPAATFAPLLRVRQPLHAADDGGSPVETRLLAQAAGLALSVWQPRVEEAGQLVREVSAIVKAEISFLDFEGLEEAPGEAVTWLRQAVRFARRG